MAEKSTTESFYIDIEELEKMSFEDLENEMKNRDNSEPSKVLA